MSSRGSLVMVMDDEAGTQDDAAAAGSDIARLVFERYIALPKTGKPGLNTGAGGGGYTVLAGVVAEWRSAREDMHAKEMRVVSMGTGTKCIGGGVRERSANGACVS